MDCVIRSPHFLMAARAVFHAAIREYQASREHVPSDDFNVNCTQFNTAFQKCIIFVCDLVFARKSLNRADQHLL